MFEERVADFNADFFKWGKNSAEGTHFWPALLSLSAQALKGFLHNTSTMRVNCSVRVEMLSLASVSSFYLFHFLLDVPQCPQNLLQIVHHAFDLVSDGLPAADSLLPVSCAVGPVGLEPRLVQARDAF